MPEDTCSARFLPLPPPAHFLFSLSSEPQGGTWVVGEAGNSGLGSTAASEEGGRERVACVCVRVFLFSLFFSVAVVEEGR